MADLIATMNSNGAFACISTSGIALFLSGQTSFQLDVTSAGPIPISVWRVRCLVNRAGSSALSSILSADETNLFAKECEVIIGRSIAAQASLASSPAGPGGVANPPQYLDPVLNKLTDNSRAISLQTVVRIMGGRSGLGVSWQIFFVQLGGFDTHDNQTPQHSRLPTQLGEALEYFDTAMTTAGLNSQVTTFCVGFWQDADGKLGRERITAGGAITLLRGAP
jgi:uncharacterized protein (DUF1501 family)